MSGLDVREGSNLKGHTTHIMGGGHCFFRGDDPKNMFDKYQTTLNIMYSVTYYLK